MTSATTYEITVHGPYVFGAVFDTGVPGTVSLFAFDEQARTLDDDLAFTVTGPPLGTRSSISGTMVQPGRITVGDDFGLSMTPSWSFEISVTPGRHDLFAITADHVLVQHGLDATHDVAVGSLDVTAQGTALDTVAFTADQTASESLTALALVETPTTAIVNIGHAGNASATKVVPDAILATTDRQTVSVRATDGGHFRALRKPFRAGDATAYALPTLFDSVSWSDSRKPSVSWGSIPPALVVASVGSADGMTSYTASLTRSFVEATNATHFTFDTELPGFDDAWRLDVAKPHDRDVIVQAFDDAADIVQTQEVSERVGTAAAPTAPLRRPRGGVEP